jgi:hypothetical protein
MPVQKDNRATNRFENHTDPKRLTGHRGLENGEPFYVIFDLARRKVPDADDQKKGNDEKSSGGIEPGRIIWIKAVHCFPRIRYT